MRDVKLYQWLEPGPPYDVTQSALESVMDTPFPCVTARDDDGRERVVAIVLDTDNAPNGDSIAGVVASALDQAYSDE